MPPLWKVFLIEIFTCRHISSNSFPIWLPGQIQIQFIQFWAQNFLELIKLLPGSALYCCMNVEIESRSCSCKEPHQHKQHGQKPRITISCEISWAWIQIKYMSHINWKISLSFLLDIFLQSNKQANKRVHICQWANMNLHFCKQTFSWSSIKQVFTSIPSCPPQLKVKQKSISSQVLAH